MVFILEKRQTEHQSKKAVSLVSYGIKLNRCLLFVLCVYFFGLCVNSYSRNPAASWTETIYSLSHENDLCWWVLGFFVFFVPPAFSILPQGWQHLTGKLTMGRSAFLVINFCGIFMCMYFGDTGSQLVKLKGKCNSLKVLWSLRFKKKGWSNLWKCDFFFENILLKEKEGEKSFSKSELIFTFAFSYLGILSPTSLKL